MKNQNKPYWLNESYLEEMTRAYNWYSLYQNGDDWKNTSERNGAITFESKKEYEKFMSDFKRDIDKVTLELEVSRQMQENNKTFTERLGLSK